MTRPTDDFPDPRPARNAGKIWSNKAVACVFITALGVVIAVGSYLIVADQSGSAGGQAP